MLSLGHSELFMIPVSESLNKTSGEINGNIMQKSNPDRGQDTNNTSITRIAHLRISLTHTHTQQWQKKRGACVCEYDSGSIIVFVVVHLWGVCVCVSV